jgi:hypothetical protein
MGLTNQQRCDTRRAEFFEMNACQPKIRHEANIVIVRNAPALLDANNPSPKVRPAPDKGLRAESYP